jgi:hypothetical protein
MATRCGQRWSGPAKAKTLPASRAPTSRRISVDDLDVGRELEGRGAAKRARGILEYRPVQAPPSQATRPAAFTESSICYGPYYTVGPGELEFRIEGDVDGKCRVLITSDEGRRVHYDAEQDSFAESIVVSAPHELNKLEVVFRTTRSLSHLRLEGISLTRWHA